jgi:hypothetical protein
MLAAMTTRRALLALILTALAAPALGEESCGCGGPKSKPSTLADHYYQLALAASDPDRKRRLAELVLRIIPDHPGALKILAELPSQ